MLSAADKNGAADLQRRFCFRQQGVFLMEVNKDSFLFTPGENSF